MTSHLQARSVLRHLHDFKDSPCLHPYWAGMEGRSLDSRQVNPRLRSAEISTASLRGLPKHESVDAVYPSSRGTSPRLFDDQRPKTCKIFEPLFLQLLKMVALQVDIFQHISIALPLISRRQEAHGVTGFQQCSRFYRRTYGEKEKGERLL